MCNIKKGADLYLSYAPGRVHKNSRMSVLVVKDKEKDARGILHVEGRYVVKEVKDIDMGLRTCTGRKGGRACRCFHSIIAWMI